MSWNLDHIRRLQAAGKIQGFTETRKKYSAIKTKNIPDHRSKALAWLDLNLQFWSNDKCLTLEKEYRFDTDRKWRFDYCWPSIKVAVEFEGGIYIQNSGHNTAKHYTKDTDKYNRATTLGWKVIRVTAKNYQSVYEHLNQLL